MIVPLPCNLGEMAECDGKQLALSGVGWFHWEYSDEWDWTYFFDTQNIWHPYMCYTVKEKYRGIKQGAYLDISDELFEIKPFKEHGYPVKATGSIVGIHIKSGRLYAECQLDNVPCMNMQVECDEHGRYKEQGNIIFPPTYNTEERKLRLVYKKALIVGGGGS